MLYCMHGCQYINFRLINNGFIAIVCACASYVILGLVPKMNLLHMDKVVE
jgi:hypothetical protein